MGDEQMLMQHAIEAATRGIAAGQTPFGAVIATRAGEPVCAAHNRVRADGDITAHAEIVAIRQACQHLGTIDLSGHVLATTCEPCPMCAAAIHWARLDAIVYGASIEDARAAGFNELNVPIERLYQDGGSRVAVRRGVMQDACCDLFAQWRRGPNPTPY